MPFYVLTFGPDARPAQRYAGAMDDDAEFGVISTVDGKTYTVVCMRVSEEEANALAREDAGSGAGRQALVVVIRNGYVEG